jgi:hypothetical protein
MNPKLSFQVMLQGRNFLLDLEGQARRYGFYTTRFVEAEDEAEAERAAVALVRDDPELRGIYAHPTRLLFHFTTITITLCLPAQSKTRSA